VAGRTVCTWNSRAGGVAGALVAVEGAAVTGDDAGGAAGTKVPITCTRRPIHGVMSDPDSRYPLRLDPELPAGAVPVTTPLVPAAVPAAPAVDPVVFVPDVPVGDGTGAAPAGGSVGSADTGGGTGDGVRSISPGCGVPGMIIASLRVIGFDADPPPTHPVIVMILLAESPAAGVPVCAKVVADTSSVTPKNTAVLMGPPLVTHERCK
jgi:hypothetical protein